MTDQKFTLLRKLLRALGLSEDRVAELIAWIEEWLSDEDESEEPDSATAPIQYPYYLREDFLTGAEKTFYRALQPAVSQWAVVFPKVRLGDLFYAQTPDNSEWYRARNRIERKHLDFLLCDPTTLEPLLGVELNDSSHQRADRRKRDRLVAGVFDAAGLPLVGIKRRPSYPQEELNRFLRAKAGLASAKNNVTQEENTAQPARRVEQPERDPPACPQCDEPMVLRTARRGKNAGNQFWGCSAYPQCKGILPVGG